MASINAETKKGRPCMDTTHSSILPGTGQINLALLFLRFAAALAFLYHGSGILFAAFGGPGPQQFASHHNWPVIVGYLVGLAQLGGALAVLTGIFFRFGTLSIFAVMLGAIFIVHLPNGYDVGNGGMEYALTQALLAVTLFLTGPGDYSLAPAMPAPLRKL
jgi:putative oxidoreductase